MKHLKDLPVLILGLGASGMAMARWCVRHGAVVTVADTREAPALLDTLREEMPGVGFVGGAFVAGLVEGTAIRAVYRSPGLAPATIAPVVDAARAMGLSVGGELDLFARALLDMRTVDVPVVAEQGPTAEAEAQADLPFDAASEPVASVASSIEAPQAPAAVEAVPADDAVAIDTQPESAGAPEIEAEPVAQAADAGTEPLPEAEPVAAAADASPEPVVDAEHGEAAAQDETTLSAPAESSSAPVEPMSAPVEPSSAPIETASATVRPTPEHGEPLAPKISAPTHQPGKPYVRTAAKEAAEFVARIAELSVPVALTAPEEEAPKPVLVAEPVAPKGYTPSVLAITGTNGKTTVTSLTGQLVERAGKTVAVAGNIGPTLLDTLSAHIDAETLPDVWVLELSSFQLDGVQGFEPTVATVLNLTQDHLDWHGDMAAYGAAKARIFGSKGLLVLNRDDDAVMKMLPAPIRVKLQRPQHRTYISFGAGMPLRPGDFGIERVNGMAWLVRALEADETQKRKRGAAQVEEEIFVQRLLPANALRIRGQHNALNALAALALASAAGCPLGPMLYGLREYRGEPHRVEPVNIVHDVEYFDDSKGTNVGATVAALIGLGVDRRIVLILGGEGKGQDFSPLAAPVRQYARAVVLIGRDAPIIEEALAGTGVAVAHAASMEEAVHAAAKRAHPGDAVLLSPACASFDMFKDYAHRAAVFCEAVEDLANASGEGDAE
ncbi:UDP-N-acetylmuramoyl-L-alanine--D-glutamate ligase [Variovorax rhizosphaerae]|uniref:UDP-N-acetylmuramoylalanine--D-glutamate ligase n=1 Tax=Variovorax rhizosphaerae TaxID=1836200 RepID=A0ABU8WGY1_9BURK